MSTGAHRTAAAKGAAPPGGRQSDLSGRAARAGAALARIPAPGLILLGMASRQVGAALADPLFPSVGPSAVTTMRLTFAAAVLLVVWRSALRVERRTLPAVVACGAALAGMNFAFYQALDRIPLGPTVAIELLGPLSLAVVASRRIADAAWALLAAAGVLLLTESGGGLPWNGVAFALAAAGCWVAYILAGARLSRAAGNGSGLGAAMAVGAVIALPVGFVDAGTSLLEPRVLLVGFGVALLASVIPYSLEFRTLRRMPPRVFGVLMSLEPAVAALAGLLLLAQHLDALQWLAIGVVVAASLGAAARRE